MAIKRWHYGKIVLLWIWAVFIVSYLLLDLGKIKSFVSKMIYMGLIFGLPVVLSVVTWKWLSAKESRDK